MNSPSDPLGIALDARAKGIVAIPCYPYAKVPMVKWKPWQEAMPPLSLQESWFQDTRLNVAILTTGLVIFDCDDASKADLVLMRCGDTPHKVRTPRGGMHLGYRRRQGVALTNRVKIQGMAIDIRTDGGLALIPTSRTKHGAYEWLGNGLCSKANLPVARIGWTRKRARRRVQTAVFLDTDPDRLLYRGRRYVDTFERAVSGKRGHTTTFVSALKIVRFVGFNRELAWQLLLYYNATKCDPPWEREADLRHKLDDALRVG